MWETTNQINPKHEMSGFGGRGKLEYPAGKPLKAENQSLRVMSAHYFLHLLVAKERG